MLQKRINSYLEYIVDYGISIHENDTVEIVGSSYINEYIIILKEILYKRKAGRVVITYTDGAILEEEINRDWRGYLDKRISLYNSLIDSHFKRISLLSPFLFPVPRTDNTDSYKLHSFELRFVYDYFYNLNSCYTICPIPNIYWAAKLMISYDALWDKLLKFYKKDSYLIKNKELLDSLKIKSLHFKTGLGTNLEVELIEGTAFLDNRLITKDNTMFLANIPSLELYTSPNKYKVNGIVVGSRPLFYKNKIISSWKLEFKDGIAINNEGLDEIVALEGCSYVGEIALVEPHKDIFYYNTLLDENLGCHLALGCGFLNRINSPYINESDYHYDLVFGSDDIEVSCTTYLNKKYSLIKNMKFKIEEIKC